MASVYEEKKKPWKSRVFSGIDGNTIALEILCLYTSQKEVGNK